MDRLYSFRYVKLGAGLILLLVSSIFIGVEQYIFGVIGGIFLTTAFASLGNYDYNEVQSKLIYRIVRYVLATLLLISGSYRIYCAFSMPEFVQYSVYSTVIDSSLIAYLLFFKPSNTSIGKKICKTLGYALVLIGVSSLQKAQHVVEHRTYYSVEANVEIDWGMVLFITIVFLIGIGCIIIGSRKSDVN